MQEETHLVKALVLDKDKVRDKAKVLDRDNPLVLVEIPQEIQEESQVQENNLDLWNLEKPQVDPKQEMDLQI